MQNVAADLLTAHVDYANNVRIHVSATEVYIDFFRTSPNPDHPGAEPIVTHIQRVALPLSVAKLTGEALVNAVSEAAQGAEPAIVAQSPLSVAYETMLASEAVLRREWDTPAEDEAWAHL